MNRLFASLTVFCAALLVAPLVASAVTIAWSPVGNPGNTADSTGYGSVGYAYNIGTYDVTNSQYVEFLNSNDPTGTSPLELYNSNMSDVHYGGINYNSGAASGHKYSVMAGKGENPVNYVTFFDTLRFANWLNNGQTPGSTETGAYTLLGGTPTPSNGNSVMRNAGATVFLPSENEWYKAAFYDPTLNSGAGGYYWYPTTSNMVPTASYPTAAPNSANFAPYFNLTAVGAYSGTTSPCGAYDMGGNVWQWNETEFPDSSRDLRGGSFKRDSNYLKSSGRIVMSDPTVEYYTIGFRVASVPEPSTCVLAAFGVLSCVAYSRMRSRHA